MYVQYKIYNQSIKKVYIQIFKFNINKHKYKQKQKLKLKWGIMISS